MKTLDLTWGNPAFLHPLWKKHRKLTVQGGEGLDYLKRGHEPLKQLIKDLHASVGNVSENDYHVVIGNGATQVLQAAIYAKEARSVGAFAPYYGRFPRIAKLAGAHWFNPEYSDVVIATLPNNPDGSSSNALLEGYDLIHDMCYNWPIYTGTVWKMNRDIMIFNLSKATGHAGSRIGWAMVKDSEIAKKMEDFIEMQTCGVSYEAQVRAMSVIRTTLQRSSNVFTKGRRILKNRWEQLESRSVPVLNSSGMFAWSNSPKYWQDLGVVGVSGETMGSTEKYIRVNIGCSNEDFTELLRRIDEYNERRSEEATYT